MTEKLKLVMATNNVGKLREARAIAGDRLDILSLEDIGYRNDIKETADTLEGNALIKVRAIKDATGYDCFADDTGLFVDALGGAPGVHTARYAGEECDPDKNMALMLKNMESTDDRRARFRTCVALALNGEEHIFEGTVEGKIARQRSGSNGFGYDPIFVPDETGICFADMDDEAKNAISHRSRAISAMMKWLSTLCLTLCMAITAGNAASASDWQPYNTFHEGIRNVFDTPEKTYFIVEAQMYSPTQPDNEDLLCFLFCLEKDSGEIRHYTPLNFLSQPLIKLANYNAQNRYLLIVYDDLTIDILYDDGEVHTITGLKNYDSASTKNVRGITFDPERNKAYLATDFGYITIDDKKHEISTSGIYNAPIDRIARTADRFIILHDGKLYWDAANSHHTSFSDFQEADWADGCEVTDLIPLSSSMCIFSKMLNGVEEHYLLSFTPGEKSPSKKSIGSFQGANIAENKNGLLLTRGAQIVQIDRETGDRTFYPRRGEDYGLMCGSWDLRDVYFAKPREGFFSLRRDDSNNWTVTSEAGRPNAPAAFRSNSLFYSNTHGMLVNSHGQDQNFSSHMAQNPILLSGLKDGEWTPYGLPYLDITMRNRLINPCGLAQDPDNPDIFYFGSVLNGLLRYNIKDLSSLLHMTRADDNPEMKGHVTIRQPYADWSNAFMLLNPKFDTKGNLIITHINTDRRNAYYGEIWVWTPENRRASTAPETFRPFTRLNLSAIKGSKASMTLPLTSASTRDMVIFFPFAIYQSPFIVYDHNGTPEDTSDDKETIMKSLTDSDGTVNYNYLYCALEDPATGLVWVGTDNGVFTFNPKEAFSNPGKVSRIKVSRNDGTSLADYLLAGISVNNIAIDGNGRKWFSLSGGGIVCTSSDGKTIIKELSTENSKIPSDNVYATCYNPSNNSLMVATSAGICEYYLSGQGNAGSGSSVKAYPNPVHHDYYGWVTIEGLEDDSIVKIADSGGNIVRELGPAGGGRVQWDVCGMDLNRVPSGVYFILASSGPGGGSYGEVGKILVINK